MRGVNHSQWKAVPMTTASLRRAVALLATGALVLSALPAASAVPRKPEPPRSAAAITAALNESVEIPGTAWMTRPDGTVWSPTTRP